MMLRKGDGSSCTDRPGRRVPSHTASPVALAKSARTIVSFSVRAWVLGEKNNHPATASPTTTAVTPLIIAQRNRDDLEADVSAPSGAVGTGVMIVEATRPAVESRVSRCKSVRISAAL